MQRVSRGKEISPRPHLPETVSADTNEGVNLQIHKSPTQAIESNPIHIKQNPKGFTVWSEEWKVYGYGHDVETALSALQMACVAKFGHEMMIES